MTASTFAAPEPTALKNRLGFEFARYLACSAAALTADFAMFSSALYLGAAYPLAGIAGFVVGLLIAYTLSIRIVFHVRRVGDERLEFMIFAGIGTAGLLLTELLLWLLVSRAGLTPMLAKLLSAGAVFLFNFSSRKWALFSSRRAGIASA